MKIEFTDREYRFENGRAPKGYGFWIFRFEGYEFTHTGTLTDAKKACRAFVKSVAPDGYVGTVMVNVEP